jgi:uncharacterized membrane protein HdeD (DUF308 family)
VVLRETGRLLALSGLLSVVLGILLIAAPGAGALALLWWIGAFAIVFGVLTGNARVPPQGSEGPPGRGPAHQR